MLIFVGDDAAADAPTQISGLLDQHLPAEVHGYPTRFSESPLEPGTPVLNRDPDGRHGVTVGTVAGFLAERLGISRTDDLDPAAWLTMSEQHLLEVTAGAVSRDDHGRLTTARRDLAWYADDVWRYRLAAGWKRIAQHEAFVGRAGEVGDDPGGWCRTLTYCAAPGHALRVVSRKSPVSRYRLLLCLAQHTPDHLLATAIVRHQPPGSHLVTMAIIRDVMQLASLLERRYAPYEKWFGTAYAHLGLAGRSSDALDRARFGPDGRTRESAVVGAERFADALTASSARSPITWAGSTSTSRPPRVASGSTCIRRSGPGCGP